MSTHHRQPLPMQPRSKMDWPDGPAGSSLNFPPHSGCLYVAFGFQHFYYACYSAYTLKNHNDLPVSIVTNVPARYVRIGGEDIFEQIIFKNDLSKNNRLYKVQANLHSPYLKTVFIDADTVILGSLAPIFYLLNYFDVAARMQNMPTGKSFHMIDGLTSDILPLPEWNRSEEHTSE